MRHFLKMLFGLVIMAAIGLVGLVLVDYYGNTETDSGSAVQATPAVSR